MFGLPVRVAQIFFVICRCIANFSYICSYVLKVMLELDKYIRYCLTSLVVVCISLGNVWAAEDSTYINLMVECMERHVVSVKGNFTLPSTEFDKYKRMAMDQGYSSREAKALVSRFEEEVISAYTLEFVKERFIEEITIEDMQAALPIFRTEQGVRASEELDYLDSEEFTKKLTERFLEDFVEILVDNKVTKKKSDLPKAYQKLYYSYFRSSVCDEATMAEKIVQLIGSKERANRKIVKLIGEYVNHNSFVVVMQLSYPKVTMETLRFIHEFNSSNLGKKFCRTAQKVFMDVDVFYKNMENKANVFLNEEYGIHPPKSLEVSPSGSSIEEDANM